MLSPLSLEIAAVVLTTLCILLAGRNSVHTWWVGIAACVQYGLVFFDAKLYAEVLLQVFFIGTGIAGWRMWLRRYGLIDNRPVSSLGWRIYAFLLAAGAVVAWLYSGALRHFTDAAAPLPDSMVLAGSVIAQILLMIRRVQTWPTWVVVNLISVPLYWTRGLHVSAALYAFYLIHALYAWRHWTVLAARRRVEAGCCPGRPAEFSVPAGRPGANSPTTGGSE